MSTYVQVLPLELAVLTVVHDQMTDHAILCLLALTRSSREAEYNETMGSAQQLHWFGGAALVRLSTVTLTSPFVSYPYLFPLFVMPDKMKVNWQ